jgi:excisionase family DNA binding protein
MEEKPLTVEQVAELFGVNRDTVRRWLREGRMKGRFLGGRAGYRITREDVRRFMHESERGDADAR